MDTEVSRAADMIEFVRKEGSRWVVECRIDGKPAEFCAKTLPAALALAERMGVKAPGGNNDR